jgi:hypothetical protein
LFKLPDDIHRSLADRQFDGLNKSPRAWAHAAQILLTSAGILGEEIKAAEARKIEAIEVERAAGVSPPFRELVGDELRDHNIGQTVRTWAMLVALAIENLLKGIIAGRGSAPVKQHGLVELAQLAQFEISPQEHDLLQDLTEYSVWKGRYLTPTKAEKLYSLSKQADVRQTSIPLWPITGAAEICAPILDRLHAEVRRVALSKIQ